MQVFIYKVKREYNHFIDWHKAKYMGPTAKMELTTNRLLKHYITSGTQVK